VIFIYSKFVTYYILYLSKGYFWFSGIVYEFFFKISVFSVIYSILIYQKKKKKKKKKKNKKKKKKKNWGVLIGSML